MTISQSVNALMQFMGSKIQKVESPEEVENTPNVGAG